MQQQLQQLQRLLLQQQQQQQQQQQKNIKEYKMNININNNCIGDFVIISTDDKDALSVIYSVINKNNKPISDEEVRVTKKEFIQIAEGLTDPNHPAINLLNVIDNIKDVIESKDKQLLLNLSDELTEYLGPIDSDSYLYKIADDVLSEVNDILYE